MSTEPFDTGLPPNPLRSRFFWGLLGFLCVPVLLLGMCAHFAYQKDKERRRAPDPNYIRQPADGMSFDQKQRYYEEQGRKHEERRRAARTPEQVAWDEMWEKMRRQSRFGNAREREEAKRWLKAMTSR